MTAKEHLLVALELLKGKHNPNDPFMNFKSGNGEDKIYTINEVIEEVTNETELGTRLIEDAKKAQQVKQAQRIEEYHPYMLHRRPDVLIVAPLKKDDRPFYTKIRNINGRSRRKRR